MPVVDKEYIFCLGTIAEELDMQTIKNACPEIDETTALSIIKCDFYPKIHGSMPEGRCDNCPARMVVPIHQTLNEMVYRVSSELAQTD